MVLLMAGTNALLAPRGDGGTGARAEIHRAQLFDLVGAATHATDLPLPALEARFPALAKAVRGAGPYYQPWVNDTLEQSKALTAADTLNANQAVFSDWMGLVTRHPGLYALTRWPVFWWTLATPDVSRCHPAFAGVEGDPAQITALGLKAQIRPQDRWLGSYARAFMGTPLLSHLPFLAAAMGFLSLLLRRRRPADLAMAGLLGGGLVFTASFFVVSIACDYRYVEFVDFAALTAGFYYATSRQPAEDGAKK